MSNVKGKQKKSMSAINIILVLQLAVMLVLSVGITNAVSKGTKENSISNMQTVADERSQIIDNYIDYAEKTLIAYSRAGEIFDIVKNPDDKEAAERAQKFTEKFSKDIVNLEGIYVSEWNTHVLAHTNKATVGMTTRKEAAPLKQLQDALKAAGDDGVYDTGIIMSPASGKQIVSMYKAVYVDGIPAGLVGLGVYTDGLVETLDTLSNHDMEHSSYSMVNVENDQYIFHNDKEKVTQKAENEQLIQLCAKYKGSTNDDVGYFEYKLDGKKYISIYKYMSSKGWIFMIDDLQSEIFAFSSSMRLYLIVFCAFCIGLIIVFNIITKKQEETARKLTSAVKKQEKTRASLTNAVFNDIVTETKNRVSFSNDFEPGKVPNSPDAPYCFIMFNISQFSNINIRYGEEAGDMVLASTAERIRHCFEGGTIYRTGSDEFVVAMQVSGTTDGYSRIIGAADRALMNLTQPHETSAGDITVSYKTAVVKKSRDIDLSVMSALKDMINRSGGAAVPGQIGYADLDAMR